MMPMPSTADPLCWIEDVAARDPARVWLIDESGEQSDYATLLAACRTMAGRLVSLGVAPGDRVAAQVEKSPEALILYLACLWIGAIYMPLNSGYTAAELDWFIADAEPVLFVADPGAYAPAHRAMRVETLSAHRSGSLLDIAPASLGARETFAPDSIAAMLYTSGTTGKPKGAMLTRANLASSAVTLAKAWRMTRDDVLIHALPVFHVHGLFVATNTMLAAGGALRFVAKFDPERVIALFAHATCLMGVPTFYTRLLASPALTAAACATMRLFVSGSAPLLTETHRGFAARSGHAILERYGMTETMMNTSNPYDGARIPGTVGPPLDGVALRITDRESGEPLAAGAIGMIEVRGPNVFAGYWRNPEKTAAEFRADGFFITGDLGRIDANGYVEIIGRGKDLVISGGLNIYPKEVEDALDAMPEVAEAAVIGVPHPDFGEAVVALVVAVPGATLDTQALALALSQKLARFKLPKAIIPLAELPRNTMGKVQKNILRERYATCLDRTPRA